MRMQLGLTTRGLQRAVEPRATYDALTRPLLRVVPQFGMGQAKGVARKQRKEKKNRAKKVRGAKKTAVLKSAGKRCDGECISIRVRTPDYVDTLVSTVLSPRESDRWHARAWPGREAEESWGVLKVKLLWTVWSRERDPRCGRVG
eukprot:1324184-Prymnesium_polylepis.1